MKGFILVLIAYLSGSVTYAQYAPQAIVSGSTAVSKNSGQFAGWATGCTIQRGLMDIADASKGFVTAGDSSMAIGISDNYIVSLGDSGVATLTFDAPLYDGPGYDFAIFENGFANPVNPEEAFLELAFVEVSSDGRNFFRFPATSFTPDTFQIPVAGVYMNARYLNNLAGKYIGGYGTPFDLNELKNISGLDINNITHVRLVDVIGSVGAHATYDKDGRKVNDPYPSQIPTGGFDLDAVGAINMQGRFPTDVNTALLHPTVSVFPNPITDILFVTNANGEDLNIKITDITGKIMVEYAGKDERVAINAEQYANGIYFISLQNTKGEQWVEKVVKR